MRRPGAAPSSTFAAITLLLAADAAFAEDGDDAFPAEQLIVAPEGAFEIDRRGTKIAVSAFARPDPILIDPKLRTCRVRMSWKDGAISRETLGCDYKIRGAAQRAADAWQIEVSNPPKRDGAELFEVWNVFPIEEGGVPYVFVRQSHDAALTLAVDGADPLFFDVKGRVFPEYPAAAAGLDTRVTECAVYVEVSGTGVPHSVVVDLCDEVFRPGTEAAIRQWRFKGPHLEGVPFKTGLSLGVKYTRVYDRGQRKYGEARVESLGDVEILLPGDPDIGSKVAKRVETPLPKQKEPPTNPTWDALFKVDHKSFAEIGVYDIRWPEPRVADEDGFCNVLFGVNSERVNVSWVEEPCDDELRVPVYKAANDWNLKHGRIEKGERLARFRGTVVFPADGSHVRFRVPEDDLLTGRGKLPDYVDTWLAATPHHRVPPKLPRAFAAEIVEGKIICDIDVGIDHRGRPKELVARDGCPGAYQPYAIGAVKKWRWTPAQLNGKNERATATVRVRFDNPDE